MISYFQSFLGAEYARNSYTPVRAEWRYKSLMALTLALGLSYFFWRWTASLNPDAIVFSLCVLLAESGVFLCFLLNIYDQWGERDTPSIAPSSQEDLHTVDIFVTTYDESSDVVRPTLEAASKVRVPAGYSVQVYLLDDGARPHMQALATEFGAIYLKRRTNRGYKAGNLKNGLLHSDGDLIVICDADTVLRESFLVNTLGYFTDPDVAWVQTPHWFYEEVEGQFCGKSIKDINLVNGSYFFDVTQRRRNRNNASFCCGAASIHRRAAVMENAVLFRSGCASGNGRLKARHSLTSYEPFAFHVSEDMVTSFEILATNSTRWKSVFHPRIEARMLSPQDLRAWTVQRLKYAAGTLEFAMRASTWSRLFKTSAGPHFLMTFLSYLSSVCLCLLILSPVVVLLTGVSPVSAYSQDYFSRLIPFLLSNELMLVAGSKGHSIANGRQSMMAALPLSLFALFEVLRGKIPKFPATPKLFNGKRLMIYMFPNLLISALLITAGGVGMGLWYWGVTSLTFEGVLANCFWLAWASYNLSSLAIRQFFRTDYGQVDTEIAA